MIFSDVASRFQSEKNSLYRERDALLERGESIVDLISGNVSRHGILYPTEILEPILAHAVRGTREYRPDPLGQVAAREAIRGYYQKRGLDIPIERIILTPGTSLSYWYCFRLLCNPGDEILTPLPTYPLFDHIAEFAGIRMVPYPLVEEQGWAIDFDRLEKVITPRCRALIVISPHNPTGRVASAEELGTLAQIARRHQIPILSDEVFSEFLFDDEPFPRAAAASGPLVFTLNGFSKMFALPGLKIGWMALSGEKPWVARAVEGLETLSDAFLPVGELQQFAIPEIFRQSGDFQRSYVEAIQHRCRTALETISRSRALQVVPPQGGFYLCAKISNPNLDEEEVALDLLKTERVLVHPGYFYNLDPPHLVASIVPDPEVLSVAFKKILHRLS